MGRPQPKKSLNTLERPLKFMVYLDTSAHTYKTMRCTQYIFHDSKHSSQVPSSQRPQNMHNSTFRQFGFSALTRVRLQSATLAKTGSNCHLQTAKSQFSLLLVWSSHFGSHALQFGYMSIQSFVFEATQQRPVCTTRALTLNV